MTTDVGGRSSQRGPISSAVIVGLLVASAAVLVVSPEPDWWASHAGTFEMRPGGWASLALFSTAGLAGLLTTPRGRRPMYGLTRRHWLLLPWAVVVASAAVFFDRDLFDVVMPGGQVAGALVAVWLFLAFMCLYCMTLCTAIAMSTWALVAALRLLGIHEPVARSWARLNRR
jgi:hypothetical protein